MHELSIAQNILEITQNNVPTDEWNKVRTIRLKIGKGAGVEPEALEFSFNAIIEETLFKKARLEIELIPFTFQCNNCGEITTNNEFFAICPNCGNTNVKILTGLELNISEIEIEDKTGKQL